MTAPVATRHCQARLSAVGALACAFNSRLAGGIGSELARFETPLVALDIVGAQLCQTELPFLKFPADQDEALLFGFVQCLQAGAFRGDCQAMPSALCSKTMIFIILFLHG